MTTSGSAPACQVCHPEIVRAMASGERPPPPKARFACHWPTQSVVVVGAFGDVDVTNAAAMTHYALGHAMSGCGLVLDLRGVSFFGTEAFSAVHRVAVGCARTGTTWSVVPSAAVRRLLRICDPQGLLPAARSVDEALATVQHEIFVVHGRRRRPCPSADV